MHTRYVFRCTCVHKQINKGPYVLFCMYTHSHAYTCKRCFCHPLLFDTSQNKWSLSSLIESNPIWGRKEGSSWTRNEERWMRESSCMKFIDTKSQWREVGHLWPVHSKKILLSILSGQRGFSSSEQTMLRSILIVIDGRHYITVTRRAIIEILQQPIYHYHIWCHLLSSTVVC